MSTALKHHELLSVDEYLAGEKESEVRHEYYAGAVTAMAGASTAHNQLALEFASELTFHLRGKPCQTFIADMKVHIASADEHWFYYPDVMVNCDPSGQHAFFCDTPAVIVEVLSPATERLDREAKFFAYRSIPSLHTYILVAQEKREVIIYRRTGTDWSRELITGGDIITIPQLDFKMPLDTLYARTGL